MIQLISTVTFAVRDMARSIEFYKKLGSSCCTAGRCGVQQSESRRGPRQPVREPRIRAQVVGRAIFRIVDVDQLNRALTAAGLMPESQGCCLGRRFFHVTDPEGHELSFAELLPVGC